MRRILITSVVALAAVLGIGSAVVATSDDSIVTQARVERSLPQAFSNIYLQQADLLGHTGLTAASLDATAMCDKGGPDHPDVGPGADWICLMSWKDPNVPMPPEGYGKFELNIHSNGCYTASGSSKLLGYQTITDAKGDEVTNPAYEFDGCFDPDGDDTPTGHTFPSVMSVLSTSVKPDARGASTVQIGCGTGDGGCSGTVVAAAGNTTLGTVPFQMQEERTTELTFPTATPAGTKEVTFTVKEDTGFGPTGPVTLPVLGG
jgi:hypothetical protein